jgi:AcrR family transcriptional regulator
VAKRRPRKQQRGGPGGDPAQETETRILDAAEQVFALVGYAGATTQR